MTLWRVLVLITSRAENIFPINTALLPQALRKISRLYFNSLHKVIVKKIMLYDDRIEIQFNAPIKVSPDSDESRRGFSLCSKTVKLTIQFIIKIKDLVSRKRKLYRRRLRFFDFIKKFFNFTNKSYACFVVYSERAKSS